MNRTTLLQDRRIGRRLIEAALARARGRGIERVELHVFSDNVRARRINGPRGG
jgi:ribosomal protein S18 acetylase RimI-like enzyme